MRFGSKKKNKYHSVKQEKYGQKWDSEMELDYIKMLSQLQYENTKYTPDNDDENDDSDEDNDEKKQDERDSAMGTLTLVLIVAGLICSIIYGMYAI